LLDIKTTPVFFPPAHKDGYFRANNYFIYFSNDAGKTWSARALPDPGGGYFGGESQANAQSGWSWYFQRESETSLSPLLYRTRDGGVSWTNVQLADNLASLFRSGWDLRRSQFVSQDVGWALVAKGSTEQLFQTIDGGQTWRRIYS
jgi:photosystem II stability/assembly factor-like uncharacterized protein